MPTPEENKNIEENKRLNRKYLRALCLFISVVWGIRALFPIFKREIILGPAKYTGNYTHLIGNDALFYGLMMLAISMIPLAVWFEKAKHMVIFAIFWAICACVMLFQLIA